MKKVKYWAGFVFEEAAVFGICLMILFACFGFAVAAGTRKGNEMAKTEQQTEEKTEDSDCHHADSSYCYDQCLSYLL